MQTVLSAQVAAFGGRSWCAVVYTPESPGVPRRVVALVPSERHAFDYIDRVGDPERHQVARANLTPSGAWTVDL